MGKKKSLCVLWHLCRLSRRALVLKTSVLWLTIAHTARSLCYPSATEKLFFLSSNPSFFLLRWKKNERERANATKCSPICFEKRKKRLREKKLSIKHVWTRGNCGQMQHWNSFSTLYTPFQSYFLLVSHILLVRVSKTARYWWVIVYNSLFVHVNTHRFSSLSPSKHTLLTVPVICSLIHPDRQAATCLQYTRQQTRANFFFLQLNT